MVRKLPHRLSVPSESETKRISLSRHPSLTDWKEGKTGRVCCPQCNRDHSNLELNGQEIKAVQGCILAPSTGDSESPANKEGISKSILNRRHFCMRTLLNGSGLGQWGDIPL